MMARLVNIWQGFLPPVLKQKQMPLIVDKDLVVSLGIKVHELYSLCLVLKYLEMFLLRKVSCYYDKLS
jgi:hypothetical protein